MKLPENNPLAYLKRKDLFVANKRVVVLVGDSITHGQVSSDYGKALVNRLDNEKYEIINAGINSELAWNVLQRIENVILCKPDIVTILIGSNDVNSILSPNNTKSYMKDMKLPRIPDHNLFRDSLIAIVERLQQETEALVGLLSIPPVGEIPESREFKASTEYSKIVKAATQKTGVAYLPLHERMTAYLKKYPGKPNYPYEKEGVNIIKKIILHHIFRKSRDEIGRSSGFKLHIDYLHLNSIGGEMVADMIEAFIKEQE